MSDIEGTESTPERVTATFEQIVDILTDGKNTEIYGRRPLAMSDRMIALKVLGFDPTRGQKTDTNYGGHTPDSYFNKFIYMSKLRRELGAMEIEGVLTKVTEGNYYSDAKTKRIARLVRFPYRSKSGYVLTADLHESARIADAEKRNTQRDKLIETAKSTVAEKYAAEVQAVYEAQCAAAGIGAEHESSEVDQ